MKKIFKKNQLIITALALMVAAAGYLSYTNGKLGTEEELAQTNAQLSEEDYDIISEQTLTDEEIFTEQIEDTQETSQASIQKQEDGQIENPGETVLTSTDAANVDFAVEAKLNREQVRSQNKESLMEIINSKTLSDAEKQAAVDKMVELTDLAQRESDTEMLLEAKGFTDVVVNISDDGADVVLNMGDVTDAKRAQIEDIVKRKAKVSAENIVITPISNTKE